MLPFPDAIHQYAPFLQFLRSEVGVCGESTRDTIHFSLPGFPSQAVLCHTRVCPLDLEIPGKVFPHQSILFAHKSLPSLPLPPSQPFPNPPHPCPHSLFSVPPLATFSTPKSVYSHNLSVLPTVFFAELCKLARKKEIDGGRRCLRSSSASAIGSGDCRRRLLTSNPSLPQGVKASGGSAVLFTRAAAAAPDGATDAPGAVTSEVTSSASP